MKSEERKELMKQLFDLSKSDLTIKDKDGHEHTISLQKKIIDRPWSGETISETLNHELPVVFLLKDGKDIDKEYLQNLTKVKDKSFIIPDVDGNGLEMFP